MRVIRDVPEDHFRIHSALGSSAPAPARDPARLARQGEHCRAGAGVLRVAARVDRGAARTSVGAPPGPLRVRVHAARGAERGGRARSAHAPESARGFLGQALPRASLAAQQRARALEAALGKRGEQPDRQAGGVCQGHSPFGQRPPGAGQCHLGFVQDRSSPARAGAGGDAVQHTSARTCCAPSSRSPRRVGSSSASSSSRVCPIPS